MEPYGMDRVETIVKPINEPTTTMSSTHFRTGSLPPKFRKTVSVLTLCAVFAVAANAQVSSYLFRRTVGTYTPITGGTVLTSGSNWNNEVYTVTLPSPFWFNGVWYPTMHVSCNGFITVGTAPTGFNYGPISSTEVYAGAISPFGTNLWNPALSTSNVRWQQVGREVVVQWQGARRMTTANIERFSFQARLNLDNGLIQFVYDDVTNQALSLERFPEVGLRGANNSFPTNVNNRLVDGTCWWGYSLPGTDAASTCRFTAKAPIRKPQPGLTYSFAWNGGMQLDLHTDNNGSQISWMILPATGSTPVCSGTGYANNTSYSLPCLAGAGQYRLVLTDAGGDGICCVNGIGGYVLRNLLGDRIIDNRDDGAFTVTSAVTLPFDMPLGNDHLVDSLCDREDYFTEDDLHAQPNEAVRAEYGIGNQADDGYQWWFYNPDGGYSRRLFMAHSTNNYWFPAGQDRSASLRIGTLMSNPLPLNKLLNVKIRSRVNGVNAPWGPACRMRIDLPNRCPAVQLIDAPGTLRHSCGKTNVVLDGSQFLYATLIPSATKYKFQFTRPGYLRNITSATSSLWLTIWGTAPLQYGLKQYQVRVSTSYDNGATWCPFGPACSITTAAQQPSAQQRAMETIATQEPLLDLWPNPCTDGTIYLRINELPETIPNAQVEVTDAFGKRVMVTQEAIAEGQISTMIQLDGALAEGIYLLTITAGDTRTTRRVVLDR
jgi:Secretion system C-terminal sorting domain